MPIQVTCPSCSSSFKAPDSAAGKRAKCPKCDGVIDIPAAPPAEEVLEAEEVPRPFPAEEYEVDPPQAVTATNDGARKPCPMCGEMISRDAVKCRYCGEIFDPVLAAQEKKLNPAPADEDLTPVEYLVAILCSNIGCIFALVWAIQGKPKWKKMLIVSVAAQFIWAAIGAILQAIGNAN